MCGSVTGMYVTYVPWYVPNGTTSTDGYGIMYNVIPVCHNFLTYQWYTQLLVLYGS
jgi:hypothetical protein